VPVFHDRHIEDGDAVIGTWWEDVCPMMSLSRAKGRKCNFIWGYEVWGGAGKKVHRAYSFANSKIAVSTWLKNLVEQKFQQQVSLCPNGVDPERFFSAAEPKGRTEFRSGSRITILAVEGVRRCDQGSERYLEKPRRPVEDTYLGGQGGRASPFPLRRRTPSLR
jgi:hypothetical protein